MPEPVLTTARSARHALPYLFPGQSQKEALVNEALARLDALVMPVVIAERDAPPADPAPGDSYIVGGSASGEWSGQAAALASWAESHWLFTSPNHGMRVHDSAGDCLALYVDGEGWRRASAPIVPAGGAVQDAEARAAIAAVASALRQLGIFG